MTLKPMYPAVVNSPGTELAADITADVTEITVLSTSGLPPAPNLLTIGSDETAETVRYTKIDGTKLTVDRAFQGGAKSWSVGTKVARYFTAYDHDAARENITDHETRIGSQATKVDDHVADSTRHITAAERSTWNAKETPDGAQAKANAAESNAKAHANTVASQAETNAKNASLPRTGGTISGDLAVTNSLAVAGRNVLYEIDQAKQSGVDAKNRIAGAVNAKGVPASAADEWGTLEWKISQITTGVPSAKITVPASTSTITFKEAGASGGRSEYYVVVTGLGFRARYIMIQQWPGTYAPRFRSEYVADKGSLVYTDTSDYTHFEAVQADSIPDIGSWNNPTITPDGFLMPVGQDSSHAGQDVFIVAMG